MGVAGDATSLTRDGRGLLYLGFEGSDGFGGVEGGAVHLRCDGVAREEFASAFGVLLSFPKRLAVCGLVS